MRALPLAPADSDGRWPVGGAELGSDLATVIDTAVKGRTPLLVARSGTEEFAAAVTRD